eukprot:6459865-Amphidinium_carterae.2
MHAGTLIAGSGRLRWHGVPALDGNDSFTGARDASPNPERVKKLIWQSSKPPQRYFCHMRTQPP